MVHGASPDRSNAARGARPLTVDDWAGAALAALRRGGVGAVAVEPLARSLGATKGSFYWHFRSRGDLLEAAMRRWESLETDAVIVAADAAGSPVERLEHLVARVLAAARPHAGEVGLHASAGEPVVARAVARVADRRIAYVTGLLADAGLAADEAGRRAHLLYATVLGLDTFAAALPDRLPDERARAAWASSQVAMVLG